MKTSKLSIILIGLILAGAANPAVSADEAPQYYQVEIIVIKHLDQSRTTQEIPRIAEPEITDVLDQDLARLEQPEGRMATEQADAADSSGNIYLVNPSQYLLKDVASRIQNAGAYQLLAHRAWLQAAPEAPQAWNLNLADIEIDPAIAAGEVKFYQRRYLHFAVAISLGAGTQANALSNAFQAVTGSPAAPSIAESRRVRLEKLVYFDQPQFGILAYVARSDFAPTTAQ